jgi:fatty-acyl-CoA synthase
VQTVGKVSGANSYVGRVLAGLSADPSRPALVHGDRSLTGAQTLQAVADMASALADSGLGPGDGVVCLHGNTIEAVLVRLAAQAIGCRYTGLLPVFATPEQAKHLASADAAALVLEPAAQDAADELLTHTDVPRIFSLGPAAPGRPGCIDLLALAAGRGAGQPDHAESPNALAVLTFTSGSTGQPKGIGRTFAAMSACLDTAQEICGPQPWRALIPLPLSDLGGDLAQWVLAGGGTVVLDTEFDAGRALATIEQQRITHFFGIPSWLYQLAEHPALPATDLSSLRRVVYGGSPANPARVARATGPLAAALVQSYGLQEAGFVCALTAADHTGELMGSVGLPLTGVQVRILDHEGTPLPAGSVGEVHVRSPMIMSGYWRQPELTAEVLRNGWLRTGDLGLLGDGGHLYLVDRAHDMIIVDGHNVYCQQVERALAEHPAVLQAAVVGVPGADGEAVAAAVVPSPGATAGPEELRDFIRRTLGPVNEPTHIRFLDEIPLSAHGKTDKATLRTHFTPPGDSDTSSASASSRLPRTAPEGT